MKNSFSLACFNQIRRILTLFCFAAATLTHSQLISTAAAQETPPPPSSVQATDGTFSDQVLVTWSVAGNLGLIGSFNVYRSTFGNFPCQEPAIATGIPAANRTFTDSAATGLQTNVIYYYSVRTIGNNSTTSTCSPTDFGYAGTPPAPYPPVNIQATDNLADRITITWDNPTGSQPITHFKLYRSYPNDTPCAGDPIAANIPFGTNVYDDVPNPPNRVYWYSMRSVGPSGEGACSAINDHGHILLPPPATVSATDGTYTNKVRVTWVPPSNSTPAVRFKLHRTTNPQAPACSSLLQDNIQNVQPLQFDDFAVQLGTVYYYSIESVFASGISNCSNIDPGYPITVCSDGLDNDGDGAIDYRSDGTGDPGCTALADNDEKDNTNTYVCDDNLDNDGDGRIDYVVAGGGDPGCESPRDPSEDDSSARLKSPAFAKFNTFLGQQNYAELINDGPREKAITVTLFNLFGQPMVEQTFLLQPNSQTDVDVNSLLKFACDVLQRGCSGFQDLSATVGAPNGLGRPDGVVDTYGLVAFTFDDTRPDERVLGRISFYRSNTDGSYSFGFARELRNPINGPAYATSNTYDPRGQGYLVPNWAEVISLGKKTATGRDYIAQGYTVNLYNQQGVLKQSRHFILQSLEERDIQAGHEFVDSHGTPIEAVYLVEVIPDDPAADYFLSVARYSSNAPPAVDPETYNFATVLDGIAATSESIFAPIANKVSGITGLSESPFVANWVETACVANTNCAAHVRFRGSDGAVLAEQILSLPPKSQLHLNASAVLPIQSTGSVEVQIDNKGIAQAMSYVHGARNELEAGFVSPARPRGRSSQSGSTNSFLNMQNQLALIATTTDSINADLTIRSFTGVVSNSSAPLNNGSNSIVSIGPTGTLSFSSNTYGSLTMATNSEGQALAEVRRIRLDKGLVDFVMPTLVK